MRSGASGAGGGIERRTRDPAECRSVSTKSELFAITGRCSPVGIALSDLLPQQSDQEVEAAITAIRGFGRWSAHMYMMFALGDPISGPVAIWPCALASDVLWDGLIDPQSRPLSTRVPLLRHTGAHWRCCAGITTARRRCELHRLG